MTRLTLLLASMTAVVLLTPFNHRLDVCAARWALSFINALLVHSLYVDVRRFYLGRLNRYQRDI